jgi:hypothetical protein
MFLTPVDHFLLEFRHMKTFLNHFVYDVRIHLNLPSKVGLSFCKAALLRGGRGVIQNMDILFLVYFV